MNRPEFHFTPATGWMNDPNGLVYDGKYYHLFYQSTPDQLEPDFIRMHWGHARSLDLISWEHLPIALAPDEHGGVFSGSAVMDGSDMVLIYTYHSADHIESQAIARSTDPEHIHFEKCALNPVLPNPGRKDFRDPKVFMKDERGLWHMALASTDRVLFYTSPDLITWSEAGSFGAPDNSVYGLWECPDMIKLPSPSGGSKWVLIFSLGLPPEIGGGKTMYMIGDYSDGAFVPDGKLPRAVDDGPDFYAGVTFSGAPDDRRIMIAWMSNWAYADRTPAVDWRGQMSCPRELCLISWWDGLRLSSRPIAPEVQSAGGGLLVVRDKYSIETFLPDEGISFTKVLFSPTASTASSACR